MRLRRPILALFALAYLLGAGLRPADARGYRTDQVPGGYEFECYMCHYRNPFTRLTVFGVLVRETLLFRDDYPADLPPNFFVGEEGNVDWATVALLDSDGDGYTNGEELGDAAGLFVQYDPQPDFPFTRPDLIDDFPCGSGTVEGPEACDGDAFAGATCADFDLPGGDLRCNDDCTIDASGCTPCGDGVLDEGEACDGPVDAMCPPGQVGTVRCIACRLDASGCVWPLDMGPPDMGPPDGASPDGSPPDPIPDGGPPDAAPPDAGRADAAHEDLGESRPDAMPDPMADAMPDAMPDGMGDAMEGGAPDAMVDGDASDGPGPGEAGSDCRVAPGRADGGGWPWLFALLIGCGLRRRGPSPVAPRA